MTHQVLNEYDKAVGDPYAAPKLTVSPCRLKMRFGLEWIRGQPKGIEKAVFTFPDRITSTTSRSAIYSSWLSGLKVL